MNISNSEFEIIRSSKIFKDFDDNEISVLITCFANKISIFDELYLKNAIYQYSSIILKGQLDIGQISTDGYQTLTMRLNKGQFLPYKLFSSETGYKNLYAYSKEETCDLLLIDYDKIDNCLQSFFKEKQTCENSNCQINPYLLLKFNYNINSVMYDFINALNDKIMLLSQKTLRNKLQEYFKLISRKNPSKTFKLPLNREELSNYLFADRSSVSREISNMQNDHIIKIHTPREIELIY